MTPGPFQKWDGPASGMASCSHSQSASSTYSSRLTGICHQQDVSAFDLAVVVLVARSNNIEDLRPLVPLILDAFRKAERGRVTLVSVATERKN